MIGGTVPRHVVEVRSIDPNLPDACAACLAPPTRTRSLVFRRADGAKERVAAVHWPYCDPCHHEMRRLDRYQSLMTVTGLIQMILVVYGVGAAMGYYDLYLPTLALFGIFFFVFLHVGKRARALWEFEHARIDDVYKGGAGAAYSFRNREYAERFAAANGPAEDSRT